MRNWRCGPHSPLIVRSDTTNAASSAAFERVSSCARAECIGFLERKWPRASSPGPSCIGILRLRSGQALKPCPSGWLASIGDCGSRPTSPKRDMGHPATDVIPRGLGSEVGARSCVARTTYSVPELIVDPVSSGAVEIGLLKPTSLTRCGATRLLHQSYFVHRVGLICIQIHGDPAGAAHL